MIYFAKSQHEEGVIGKSTHPDPESRPATIRKSLPTALPLIKIGSVDYPSELSGSQ
jgi:hypothetical protein